MKKLAPFLVMLFTVSALAADLPQIAVYVTGARDANEGGVLSSLILEGLVKSGRYRAIERSDDFVAQLNKEQVTQHSGAIDDEQIRRLGIQAGVQYICVVAVRYAFESALLDARIIDVETAAVKEISTAESRMQSMTDIRNISNMIVAGILGQAPRNASYTLSTSVTPRFGGSISRAPNLKSYPAGTVVTLTAIPGKRYAFERWAGASNSTSRSIDIPMESDMRVTALFHQRGAGAVDKPAAEAPAAPPPSASAAPSGCSTCPSGGGGGTVVNVNLTNTSTNMSSNTNTNTNTNINRNSASASASARATAISGGGRGRAPRRENSIGVRGGMYDEFEIAPEAYLRLSVMKNIRCYAGLGWWFRTGEFEKKIEGYDKVEYKGHETQVAGFLEWHTGHGSPLRAYAGPGLVFGYYDYDYQVYKNGNKKASTVTRNDVNTDRGTGPGVDLAAQGGLEFRLGNIVVGANARPALRMRFWGGKDFKENYGIISNVGVTAGTTF